MFAPLRYQRADQETPSTPLRVAVVVNFVTTYRADFYRRLLKNPGTRVTIYCHEAPPQLNLPSIHHEFSDHVRVVSGLFIRGEQIVVSALPWRELFYAYDAIYIEGNPRYLSLALLATLLRLTRRKVILWTMVHSFRDSRAGHAIRLSWYRLFNRLLVYSDKEAIYLKASRFSAKVVSINNGIDYERIDAASKAWPPSHLFTWRSSQGLGDSVIVLSCARLEQKNKFLQFLNILPRLLETHPNVIWCIIGDGPERDALEARARQLGVASNIRFLGRLYEEAEQAPWFLSSRLLIHPGAIGLTILHAMAFGLPVVTHHNARHHGPEFAIMRSGETGLTHTEDSLEDMLKTVRDLLLNPTICRDMGTAGRRLVATQYNTREMVRHFLEFLQPHTPNASPNNQ
jgi:glycosyltransferase involved in cell wall biosynthesis